MKKNIKLIILMCSFAFVVSCYEDRGNYDYVDINVVSITNGGDSSYYVIAKRDTIRINPHISGTLDENADNNIDRYSYSWGVGDIKTKNLVYPVDLEAGVYNISLKVQDKVTLLVTTASWAVEVGDLYKKGFIILTGNENKNAQLDMVSLFGKDTIYVKNLLSNTDMPPVPNPRMLFTGSGWANNEIYIIGKHDALKVDRNKFTHNPVTGNFKNNFMSQDLFDNFTITHILDPASYRGVIIDGYAYSAGSVAANFMFVYPFSRYMNKLAPFKVADKLAMNYKLATDYSSATDKLYVLYNMDEKRFVYLGRSAQSLDSLKDTKNDIDKFSWKTGLDYVTTTHSYFGVGDNFTLLKDKVGGYFLYQYSFSGGWMATLPKKIARHDISKAPDIANAKYHCFSANQSFMFYAVGKKIYGYDYRKNVPTFEMDMGGEVTCIYDSPHKAYEGGKDFLYIASFAGTPSSGKIVKKHIINNPNIIGLEDPVDSKDVSYKVEWTGLNKVIDFIYKQ